VNDEKFRWFAPFSNKFNRTELNFRPVASNILAFSDSIYGLIHSFYSNNLFCKNTLGPNQ